MANIQNELKYSIAWSVLKNLLASGKLTQAETKKIHDLIAAKYRPMTVRRLA